MRIIFVGLHNKGNLMPLDSSTKTGKLVNRIINGLPKHLEIVKTNLFDVSYLPLGDEVIDLSYEWYWKHLPVDDDIIVLFGGIVHKSFIHNVENLIKVAHPASKWSHQEKDEYVADTITRIYKFIT